MFGDIDKNAVVGTKQVLRAMQCGKLEKVYLAGDADVFLQTKLKAAAYEANTPVEIVPGMKQLGIACKIDVGAACVGIPKG